MDVTQIWASSQHSSLDLRQCMHWLVWRFLSYLIPLTLRPSSGSGPDYYMAVQAPKMFTFQNSGTVHPRSGYVIRIHKRIKSEP